MAAKPVLFWALVRGQYGDHFRVIGVTSEQRRQVYGRDGADAPTHVSARDVLHRFPEGTTEDYAKAASMRAQRAKEKYAGTVKAAHRKYLDASAIQQTAILNAAKGLDL